MVWKIKRYKQKIYHRHNFGDYLSFLVVKSLYDSHVSLAAQHEKGKLLAIGSILWGLQDRDVIWGSGALHPNQVPCRRDVRCLAVRGPLTLQELKRSGVVSSDCDPLFFDPAIITPLLFPDLKGKPTAKGRISLIPHYSDIEAVRSWQRSSGTGVNIVNPFAHPLRVAEAIAQSEKVVSSSLHGLILADSLGVPSVPLRMHGNKEPILKYEDYYQGSGRSAPRFSIDIDEALRRDPIAFSYKKKHLLRCLASFPFAMKKEVAKQLIATEPAPSRCQPFRSLQDPIPKSCEASPLRSRHPG
jgi:pyruvyltransferase